MNTLEFALDAMEHDLLALDNLTVIALAGNANNPHLQSRILDVKGGDRSVTQPVGWTRPFDERVIATFDTTGIVQPLQRELMSNPDLLTNRLGGLAFVRVLADQAAKSRLHIPTCIIPNQVDATVQVYSPTGNQKSTEFINAAIKRGIEPIMTSANLNAKPECVSKADAEAYIDSLDGNVQPPVMAPEFIDDSERPDKPRGSYPIVMSRPDGFEIIRPGCFSVEITRRLLDGCNVYMAAKPQPVNHTEHVLGIDDLPSELQRYRGARLRCGLLRFLEW